MRLYHYEMDGIWDALSRIHLLVECIPKRDGRASVWRSTVF